MFIKIFFLTNALIISAFGDVTIIQTSKNKRGIYPINEAYNTAHVHMPRYSQIDPSQVDLTYKPSDVQAQISSSYFPYEYNQHKNNPAFKSNEQTYSSQEHIPTYNQYHQFNAPKPTIQHQYPLTLQPKISSPLHHQFASSARSIPEVKLSDYSEFSSAPIIYGQPSAKYIQPLTAKSQYNLAPITTITTTPTTYPFLQQYKPFKVLHSQPLKTLQSNYYQPQVFSNPIVPQLQHYIPTVYNTYSRPVTSAPIQVVKNTPKKPEKPQQQEEDDDEDEDGKHQHREEIKGEITHQEVNDEEEFEKGYKDAARDFPAYERDDDDDDYDHQRHFDDDSERYGKYRSRYEHDDDHDDDPEAHYSQKQHKKEPREKHREVIKTKHESIKHYKGERDERPSKKPHTVKYYKTTTSYPRKSSDSRHESTSPKKSVKKTYKQKESKGDSEFKPTYQYGFEPIKSPYGREHKHQEEDTVAKHSSPISSKKVITENWYVSKSSSKS